MSELIRTLVRVENEDIVQATKRFNQELDQAGINASQAVADAASKTPNQLMDEGSIAKALNVYYIAGRGVRVKRELVLFNRVKVPFFTRPLK